MKRFDDKPANQGGDGDGSREAIEARVRSLEDENLKLPRQIE